jgi:hypothetical protein
LTSLASLLGTLTAILQIHPLCVKVTVLETKEFSSEQFYFKIRAKLVKGSMQVRIYYNREHIDYAYQYFTNEPLLRWDNKEEFHGLITYPHHYHDEFGNVKQSLLAGDPIKDIEIVLQEISGFLSRK